MQTHGGAAAAEAITAPERFFKHRLRVDWDGDGSWDHPLTDMTPYIPSTSRDQAVTSTAPEELLLAEGYAAAELTVVVAGEFDGIPLAHHFAPFNARSVFYARGLQLGVDMEYTISVWTVNGWVDYPQFTGVVRNANPRRGSEDVEIQCLDNVEKLRTPVDLPPYALWESHLQKGYKRGQLVDSSALIDLAARTGGFDAGPVGMTWPSYMDGPTYQAGTVLSVPFHGSILPEVGTLDGDQGIHPTESLAPGPRSEAYRAGPFGYLARNAPPASETATGFHKFWIDELGRGVAGTASTTMVLGGWFYWAGPDVDADVNAIELRIRSHRFILALESSNGACMARFMYNTSYNNDSWNSGTWETINGPFSSLPAQTPGWHYYEAAFKWYDGGPGAGDIWMRATIDGRRGTPKLVANRAFVDRNDRFSGLVQVNNTWAVSDVKIWNSRNKPPLEDFTYDVTPRGNAVFPATWGKNRLTHTVRETGLEAWTLAKDVASAEYGAVFFDEAGRFVFWNYQDVIDKQASVVRTYTVDDLGSLAFSYSTDAIRNVWVVTTQSGKASPDILYDLAEDGVPLRKAGNEYVPAVFEIPPNAPPAAKEFFLLAPPEAISVNPWTIPTIQSGPQSARVPGYWDQYTPRHGRQMYTGSTFIQRQDGARDPNSEQKFTSRDMIRLFLDNGWNDPYHFVNPDGSARFRVEGLSVVEEEPKTWIVRDTESVAQYGQRVIELRDNPWLQDEWQTAAMLTQLVARTSRPIPVTDDIVAPGDPRIQLGDTIEVRDPDGMGESIRLQILGIKRDFSVEGGLRDTYQVEVIEPARVWKLGSPSYSRLGESTILG
ncbi:hypothetical protein SAMN02982929_07239 [Saccharopolyspora kobensis]|uniref:Uncharacterized protein n=1 Tax=Saccharopolyspora kobensis TaxID=146035 RepID=A0A1H6EPX6_9PSEU|nr:hypothetical protein [Saccharopolyspora kobensis]SEG98869.1 hypothetical protein SAMN02982929_07239 [Saccharopolyspora kobensis]SFD23267.1 hypothetical protein SAMN05216506_103160 [Saccharopolyspora kobensis]